MYFLCTGCKKKISSPVKPVWLCDCGMPLEVHYSWEGNIRSIDVDDTELSLWRYSSVLPNVKNNITLGEGHTPLFPIGENILVKDHYKFLQSNNMAIPKIIAFFENIQKIIKIKFKN